MSETDIDPDFLAVLVEMRESVLFTDDPVSVHMKNAVGETPIHVFAVRGDVHGVKRCHECGSDINAGGEHGFTPLHEAAVQGHVELVRHLLRIGADPFAKSDWSETPLEAASNLGDEVSREVLEILGAAMSRRTSN